MRKWPAQVSRVVANVGRELSLLKMAIDMANADYLSFFSMEWTGAPLPTAGSLELASLVKEATGVWLNLSTTSFVNECTGFQTYNLIWAIAANPWRMLGHINNLDYECNKPISQVPQCIRKISNNASLCNRNVHTCAHFCHKVVHCGIWHRCIVEFVRLAYCFYWWIFFYVDARSIIKYPQCEFMNFHLYDLNNLVAILGMCFKTQIFVLNL